MPKPRIFLLTLSMSILVSCLMQGNSLNVATSGKYPYSDPQGGRDNYSLSGEKVNEARVYEFYQRQADYYMANPDKIPQVIPAHPGLDGGLHDWGKYNQIIPMTDDGTMEIPVNILPMWSKPKD